MELEPHIVSALIGAGMAGGLLVVREIVVSVRRSLGQRRERRERVHRALFLLLRLREGAYLSHPRREELWHAAWKEAVEEKLGAAFARDLGEAMLRKQDLLAPQTLSRKMAAGLSDVGGARETLLEVAAGDPVLATGLAAHLGFFDRLEAADSVADALREDEKGRGVPVEESGAESGRSRGRAVFFDDGIASLDRAVRSLATRADSKVRRSVLRLLAVPQWNDAQIREDARREALALIAGRPRPNGTTSEAR